MDSSDRGGSLFRIALITHALANLIGFAGELTQQIKQKAFKDNKSLFMARVRQGGGLSLLQISTFCLIDVWIWVRMSEVSSVLRPGYGHFRLPIIELILNINIIVGI